MGTDTRRCYHGHFSYKSPFGSLRGVLCCISLFAVAIPTSNLARFEPVDGFMVNPTATDYGLKRKAVTIGRYRACQWQQHIHQTNCETKFVNIGPELRHHVGMEMSSLITALEVFDGNSVVDPVIVSSSFFRTIQTQLLSALLGQFLAAVIFSLVTSFFATKLDSVKRFILDRVEQQLSPTSNNNDRTDQKTVVTAKDVQSSTSSSSSIKSDTSPDFGKLLVCIGIDIIGSSSELVPILGELSDIVWAPIAATLLQNLFGSNRILFFLELTEELLPLVDILPLATLAWVIDTYFADSDIAQLLNLGIYNPSKLDRTESAGVDTTRRRQNFDLSDKNDFIDVEVQKFRGDD